MVTSGVIRAPNLILADDLNMTLYVPEIWGESQDFIEFMIILRLFLRTKVSWMQCLQN